jgi:glutamyl-tRNA reductase
MSILLIGLNHHTAPLELRERLSLAGCGLAFALEEMPVHPHIFKGDPALGLFDLPPILQEGVILSTCNRLEIYAAAHEIAGGKAALESFLSRLQGIPPGMLKPHLYFMHDQEAALHLMRVAAGLDSMILGEPQILGQVGQALASARGAGAAGPILNQLFTQAVHAGKRARTETSISRHTTSVGHAAALLAEDRIGDLAQARALLIGAGEMAEVAAQALLARGLTRITCISRTYASAQALADKINGRALAWQDLPQGLIDADVVISATGAPHTVIQAADVSGTLADRGDRPLVMVDIAVPRDIETAVGGLPGVHLVDIDDLQSVLDDNMAQRETAVPLVENIVEQEATAFARWMNSRQVAPLIADLHDWAGKFAASEVERALNHLGNATPREREVIEMLAHRLVNKFLHEPTIQLRKQAGGGDGYIYAGVIRELFALGEAEAARQSGQEPGRNGNGQRQAAGQSEEAVAND